MWNFLLGFLFARATGISRYARILLVLPAVGILIAGLIYAVVVFHALSERSAVHHVQSHSTR